MHLDENGENPFKDMYIMSLFFTINAGLNSEIGTVNTVDNTEYSLNMLYSFTDASGFTITESPIGTGVYQFMNLTSIIGVGGDGPQVSTITKTNSGDPVVIVENVTVNSLPGHLVHLDQTSFTDINHNIDGNNNDDYYYCTSRYGICDTKKEGYCKWGNHIRGLKQIKFKNRLFNIPKNVEEFLEESYGKDWRIPKRFTYLEGLASGYTNLIN